MAHQFSARIERSEGIDIDNHAVAAGCVLRAKALRHGVAVLSGLPLGETGAVASVISAFEAEAGKLEAAVKTWIDKQSDPLAAHALAHRQYWRFQRDGSVTPMPETHADRT